MMDYEDFKKSFFEFLGFKDLEFDGKNYKIKNIPIYIEDGIIKISDEELKSGFDNAINANFKELTMLDDNRLEVAIESLRPSLRREEILIKDSINDIDYSIAPVSIEYALALLIKLFYEYSDTEIKRRCLNLRYNIRFFIKRENCKEVDLKKLLSYIFREKSLVIETHSGNFDLQKLKNAFIFNYMYKKGKSLIEYSSLDKIFHIHDYTRLKDDRSELDAPPLRVYTNDVVDYYKLGISSIDPFIQFISFYHVLEYFYDEVFKRKIVDDLKIKLTHPDFSYNDDNKIYGIATYVKKMMKINNDYGQGDELQSLSFVLNEYINIDDLKEKLNEINPSLIDYYSNNKVSFCISDTTFNFKDTEGVISRIAKRIYSTRNALVHSKSGKNTLRYKPYKNENDLSKEIYLIRIIAEQVIINSSEILD